MPSLKELGILIDAQVIGNPELLIDGVSSLDDGKPSTISYLYSKKYEKYIAFQLYILREKLIFYKTQLYF